MAPEVKTAKNSKLPKLSENYFDLVGKGGWPPISILLSLKFRPHMATRTPHRQNRNEVIHGTGLIPQHCKRVKNYTK
jgi:hypothetical protein